MTFGTQTSEAEGHAQIDRALAAGINFVDTAEMYPVNPVSKDTVGRTEEIVGTWNAANAGRRGDYILATKHSGEGMMHARDGRPDQRGDDSAGGGGFAAAVADRLYRPLPVPLAQSRQLHVPQELDL